MTAASSPASPVAVLEATIMSAQYDGIHDEYTKWRKDVYPQMEKENVRQVILDEIRGANVLELACGSGNYTFSLMEWGAKSVVASDISPAMIEVARHHPDSQKYAGRVQFDVRDGSKPQVERGAPFDVVIAIWFLSYAPDRETMSRMFQHVAINLKAGGKFITTVIRPSSDPARAMVDGTVNFWAPDTFRIEARHSVTDGVAIRCILPQKPEDITWDCFYLSQEAHEAAAREGGLRGGISYREPVIPVDISRKYPSPEMDRLVRGETTLHFNIMTVSK